VPTTATTTTRDGPLADAQFVVPHPVKTQDRDRQGVHGGDQQPRRLSQGNGAGSDHRQGSTRSSGRIQVVHDGGKGRTVPQASKSPWQSGVYGSVPTWAGSPLNWST
jgi:hypothetical protein